MFESYNTLVDGESLVDTAKIFNTTIKNMQDLNNICDNSYIRENMDLIVPKKGKEYFNYYTVKKGDALYRIGREYNINPELLAALNGLNMDDYIYPDNKKLIPRNGYSYYIILEYFNLIIHLIKDNLKYQRKY